MNEEKKDTKIVTTSDPLPLSRRKKRRLSSGW